MGDMTRSNRSSIYRRHRFPPDVIAHAVWLYLRFPLSLRMVEDLLAERGIIVSHQTIRMWVEKFGRQYAAGIRRRSAGHFDGKWHLDEVVITIRGNNTGCGGLSIKTALFWMCWCKAAAIQPQPSASCVNYSNGKDQRRAS